MPQTLSFVQASYIFGNVISALSPVTALASFVLQLTLYFRLLKYMYSKFAIGIWSLAALPASDPAKAVFKEFPNARAQIPATGKTYLEIS